eukprot:CAMPEP_0194275994 /NCGR_PEP_ID=MMETSP0169-20130528/8694_1 /TAXON_ID=218684 /ORGANISM="Corethron pennatum, Strain L29A3" /LENGTH=62 /DNA_ID=CAMNT_0039019603 /DNA_START=505 /DNA_END=693 /DNA_ORIENTATION=-
MNAYKAWEVDVMTNPRTVKYATLKHVSTFEQDSKVAGQPAATIKVIHKQNFWYWYKADFMAY